MARGDFGAANATLDKMVTRLSKLGQQRLANAEYAKSYVERFLAKPVRAGAAAVAAPNKLLQVMPDKWRFSLDEADEGIKKNHQAADFEDSKWPLVSTYSATLDSQGYDKASVLWYRTHFTAPAKHGRLTLFFGEIDGQTEVYVNGTKISVVANPAAAKKPKRGGKQPAAAPAAVAPEHEGQGKSRAPFEVDVTDAVHDGDNVLSLRVDHTRMTDLSLGGILRPVLLIEKPQ